MSNEKTGGEQPYRVMTAFGGAEVLFSEDGFNQLSGDAEAIAWLRYKVSTLTNGEGITMDVDTVTPNDFMDFCQQAGSGITILPPTSVLIARSDEAAAEPEGEEEA